MNPAIPPHTETLSIAVLQGPLLTLIPAWISNHLPGKVWYEITYPFQNFNGCTVEVSEWISNSFKHW